MPMTFDDTNCAISGAVMETALATPTIAIWVNHNDLSTTQRYVGLSPETFVMRWNSGDVLIQAYLKQFFGSFSILYTSQPGSGWHHVAMTFDGTNWLLYVDGGLVNSGTPFALQATDGVWDISRSFESFHGNMDDARVYNRALSSAEIATLVVLRGVDGITNGLILRHPMQQGSPGTAIGGTDVMKDYAGLNNGTTTGSPVVCEGLCTYRRRAA